MKKLILTLCLLLSAGLAVAQTVVTGQVIDGETGEPLPFVVVQFTGTAIGGITDFDGYYELSTTKPVDSVTISFIGYRPVTKAVVRNKKQQINVHLMPESDLMDEVVIKPGVNPAIAIIEKARDNRKNYNIDKLENYEYESYTKVQLAIDNIADNFKKRKIFKAVEPLFDTVSTLKADSQAIPVLPVFVSETISDYYYRKTPRRTRELIKASKVNGVGVGDDSYVSQLLGSTFQQYNFYDNNLYILDKDFISPISSQALSYYVYQLVDSVYIDGFRCYQIRLHPKNKLDLVFKGMIWITAESYAIKQISVEITNDANINFIEKLKIQQTLSEIEPGAWVPSKLRVLIDISEITEQTVGMIGLYYNSNENIKVNQEHELKFYDEKLVVLDQARDMNDIFWDSARHERISQSDIKIYKMVDSLKNQPIIKTYVDVVEFLVEGYRPFGKIEIGPYHYLGGYNSLEGFRTRIGFRTNEDFSKHWLLKGYGAYGFLDQQFKWMGSAEYIISRTKWAKVGAFHKRDIEQIGVTDRDYGTSALFDAFSLLGSNRLNRTTEYLVHAEKELFKGYTQKILLQRKSLEFEPIGDFNFEYFSDPKIPGMRSSDYTMSTVTLEGRLSHKELFIIRQNRRISLGNLKAPVLNIRYTHGFNNLLDGDFEYDQINLHLWQYQSLANLGTFEYNIKAGKTYSAIPYPSLFVMRGNQSVFSNKETYNLMNFFEFVADEYVSAHYEHQFNGLILNRVPLLKRLKWRSFVNGKAVYGRISEKNLSLIPTSAETGYTVTEVGRFTSIPYVEVGYGVENILRFIRIDFIHRVTYLNNENQNPFFNDQKFGVKINAVLRF